MTQWRHKPDFYVQTAAGGVFTLIARDFAPRPVRLREAVAREEEIPHLFAQARANLTGVDKETASIAAEDADGTVDLLRTTIPQYFAGTGDPTAAARFRSATARAVRATRDFASYLRARWVAIRSARSRSARRTTVRGCATKRASTSRSTVPCRRAEGARADARRVDRHREADRSARDDRTGPRTTVPRPPDRERPPAGRASRSVKLRTFVIAHHIIDLPPDARIRVTPTPQFMRSTTEAAEDCRDRSRPSPRRPTTSSRRPIRTIRRRSRTSIWSRSTTSSGRSCRRTKSIRGTSPTS